VRRAELFGSETASQDGDADDAYDDELRATLEAQIAKSLGFVEPTVSLQQEAPTERHKKVANHQGSDSNSTREASSSPGPAADGADGADGVDDAGEQGYMFRLFSTSTAVPKVVLEDEDEELKGDGGLVQPRPISYYWVKDVPEKLRQQYEFAAVSGDEVLARSTKRYYGHELPWKVTTITVTKKVKGTGDQKAADEKDASGSKRKRPGKKRRITVRTKERAKKAKEEAAAKQNLEKEEHVKEKKKRLNRLKKMRKRAKAREKKTAGGGDDGQSNGEDSGSE
jgi:hypothetical protein